MDIALLNLFALARPTLVLEPDFRAFGFEIFEIVTIFLSALMGVAFLAAGMRTKQIRVSSIDLLIALFSVWCISTYLLNIEEASWRELIRVLLPLLSFTLAKNIVQDTDQYRRIILLMIIGFTIPTVGSSVAILLGHGLQGISYWTGEARYEGIYSGPHDMAHNMTFLLMLIILCYFLQRRPEPNLGPNVANGHSRSNLMRMLFFALATSSLFCLYQARVRTAILGLLVFVVIYLWEFNRRLLFLGIILGMVVVVVLADKILPRLLLDVQKVYENEWEVEELGSGRLRIWSENILKFRELPLERIIAGNGLGSSVFHGRMSKSSDQIQFRLSHNDFLKLLIETGVVGLFLFLALQIAILRAILRLQGRERVVFLAIFTTAQIMNFASNSYVSRFSVAQMLYLVLSYIELPVHYGYRARWVRESPQMH